MVSSRKSVPSTSPVGDPASALSSTGEVDAVSLYELALELEPDLQSVALGSTTLRAAMTSFVDLLVDHPSPTMMWSKLPRGESWQLELERYCRQSAQAQAAFNFYFPRKFGAVAEVTTAERDTSANRQDDAVAHGSDELPALQLRSPEPGRLSLMDSQGEDWLALAERLGHASARPMVPRFSIPLERGGDLSGEYFLLVTSPQFQGLILARRFKRSELEELEGHDLPGSSEVSSHSLPSVSEPGEKEQQLTREPNMSGSSTRASVQARGLGDETVLAGEQRSQLRMIYTCNPLVIGRILAQIKTILAQVPTNYLSAGLGSPLQSVDSQSTTAPRQQEHGRLPLEASIPVEELLRHWHQLFVTPGAISPEMELLNQWIMKQFQRQEALWRRLSSYRKQAEQGEIYHRNHDELLNSIRLKDEFLDMVVQELRTPLTNMKTALSLLNSPALKPPQRQRYVQLLNTECDRQNSLINGLVYLNQIEQFGEAQMQALSLSEVLPGIVSTYEPLAQEKGIRLSYNIPEELPTVACLLPWVRQVMANLLENAIKYTPSTGQVWVRAKCQGDYVQIDVQDTGVGIAIGEVPKIFNRFYRVRSQAMEDQSGAGLGLTIVQQLLLRCGGSVTVNSRLGQGTTFAVLLPLYGLREEQVLKAVGS